MKGRVNPKQQFPGCSAEWFNPTETDEKDNYCLSSAVKFKLNGTRYEAGLSAFDNLLTAKKEKNTI